MRARPRAAYGAIAIVAAIAFGSCGEEDSGSPLDEALGYLPADAAVAIAISTDLESEQYQNLDNALQRFGVVGGLDTAVGGALEYSDVSFSSEIEPLLGDELVVGLSDVPSGLIVPEGESSNLAFTAAMRTADGAAVEELLTGPGELKVIEEVAGATVYGYEGEEGSPAPQVAVEGDVVVVAESAAGVAAALERTDAGEGLDEEAFEERLGDLPEDALVRASADAQTLLDAAGADVATSVPWIGALESFGLSASIGEQAASLELLATTSEVSEEELPIAAGSQGPSLLADGISVANLDQAQTIRFLLDAIEASVPSAAFEEVAGDIADQAGTELPELASAFGEGVRGERASGGTFSRTEVSDPGAVAGALSALKDEVPRLQELAQGGGSAEAAAAAALVLIPALPVSADATFEPGTKVEEVPGEADLYRMREQGRRCPGAAGVPEDLREDYCEEFLPDEFVFGLIGDVFVTAPDLEFARRVAAGEPSEDAGLPGALAGRFPLDASDFSFEGSEGGGVTVTVLELGIEATTDSMRLRLEAGL